LSVSVLKGPSIFKDVITTGASVLETTELLRSHGLVVDTALVFLDREQGGKVNLARHGVNAHCVTNIDSLVKVLKNAGRLSEELSKKIISFTYSVKTSMEGIEKCLFIFNFLIAMLFSEECLQVTKLTYHARLGMLEASNNVSKLLEIMNEKMTNLCLSADLNNMSEITSLINKVGPKLCCVKLHYDIVS